MYLLGACRRNSSFMYLGIAVRAAYAVGLHRHEVSRAFPIHECMVRERLWKALRTLDLFLSASLGRPPSTAETRNTECDEEYSASNDLCAIFEKILIDVYSRRMISTEVLTRIGAHHRRWASRFFRGSNSDRLPPDHLPGTALLDIGLLHIKEAYYWSIMLLTRPFFTESVILHAKSANASKNVEPCTSFNSNKIPIHACVDSAVRTIDLLQVLLRRKDLPKRLPFINNSLFIAALVVGMAFFGDLYQVFPLEKHLRIAHELLSQFKEDPVARRNADIVGYLREACETHLEKRSAQSLDFQNLAVRSMFGQIHHQISQASTRHQSPSVGQLPLNPDRDRSDGNDIEGASTQGVVAQTGHVPAVTIGNDDPFAMDASFDFATMPYPVMSPRTLWFDSHNENTPLFSTISTNDYYSTLGLWDAV